MNNPRIVRTDDADGRAVVYVEMSNRLGVFAKVDEADFDALLAAGVSSRWILNSSGRGKPEYVRVALGTVKGGIATVARLILNAGPGEGVSYQSYDHLDLRRANLVSRSDRRARARAFTPADLNFAGPRSLLALPGRASGEDRKAQTIFT